MPKVKKSPVEKKHGVTVTAWTGHPVYKWRVSFPDGDKRRSKGFKKKSGQGGAQEFADEKRGTILTEGVRHEDISPEERMAVVSFRQLVKNSPLPHGKPTLTDAVNFYAEHLAAIPSKLSAEDKADLMRAAPESFRDRLSLTARSLTFDALKNEHLDRLERTGRSESHQKDIKRRLGKFSESYGDWLACDLTQEIIVEWLLSIPHSPQTQHHYGRALFSLFKLAKRKGAVKTNPVDLSQLPEVVKDAPEIFSPDEVSLLLNHADEKIVPALAIAFFAGLRPASELARLDWNEVDLKKCRIHVRARARTKTRKKGRYVKISDNLASWLAPYEGKQGLVRPSSQIWRARRLKAMEAAKVEWPYDGTRHSFGTYHYALHENLPLTAKEMGHTNLKTFGEHYENLADEDEATAFWSIAPTGD